MNFLKHLLALFQKSKLDAEMNEEMRSHIEMRTQENIASGMEPGEAHHAARRQFGPAESIKETCRDQRGLRWLDNFFQDLRFGARQLRKNPGFAAVAVITLAFGIGANTVIFTLINAVLFKPVMARRADQLASLYQQDRSGAWRHFSYPDFVDLRANKDVFADLAVVDHALIGVRDGGLNEMIPACFVSANYFSLLGVPPALGRGFLPEEETSFAPVAVLTHAFWQRLGGDPAIIGRTLKLTRGFATVVGVMPRGFTGDRLGAPALFLSLGEEEALNYQPGQPQPHILSDRALRQFTIVGRLKDGLNLKAVGGALSVLNARFPEADPNEARERTLVCTPPNRHDYHERPEGEERQGRMIPFAVLAQSLTLLVLFIACLNLANMMLARGASRHKEIAVRLSVGAGRSRILRQLLTEGLLLAGLGGGAGVVVLAWGAGLLGTIVAERMGMELPMRNSLIDWRLFAALSGFSLLATLLVALGPALRLSRLDFNADLKRAPDADAMGRGKDLLRLKNLFAMGQMALVMTMLIAAALFARSARNAVGANPGFDFGSNFFIRLDERGTGDAEPQALELIRAAGERIAMLPGVASVSPAQLIPFGPARATRRVCPGVTLPAQDDREVPATYNVVGMNYFQTLGVTLLRGREFNRAEVETTNAPPSVIINQKLAAQSWPGQDPIGQTLQVSSGPAWRSATVVGVGANVDWNLFDLQQPAEYYEPPAGHFAAALWNLHVRVAPGASTDRLMAACREALSPFDARIPVPQIRTLTAMQRTSPQVLLMELGGGLFGVFGMVAIFLSFLGVYGLKAYEVTRRTREIGIRMALGATAGEVLGMILRESARLALWGIGLGFLLSLAVGRLAGRFLYQIHPFDPLTYGVIPVLLLAVSLFACWLPARRAARTDPMTALRTE